MKRILLSALAFVPVMAISQVTIFTENFDSYSSGDYAGEVSSFISTWSGVVGAASSDDTQLTDTESSSASISMPISGPSAGGATDPLVVFPNVYTSGTYHFAMKYKVAAGQGGYWNIQANNATPVDPMNTAWIAEVYMKSDGTGTCDAGGQTFNFAYTNGAWIDIDVIANLDFDQGEIIIEGNSIGTFQWSLEAGGMGTGAWLSFGGINLYAAADAADPSCEYYVDDLMLEEVTGVGVEEQVLNPAINVVPNPSKGDFKVNYIDLSMENATVTLVDILGKTIYSENMSVVGNGSLPFDLDLRNGVYFVTIADGKSKMTKKIIVKK